MVYCKEKGKCCKQEEKSLKQKGKSLKGKWFYEEEKAFA